MSSRKPVVVKRKSKQPRKKPVVVKKKYSIKKTGAGQKRKSRWDTLTPEEELRRKTMLKALIKMEDRLCSGDNTDNCGSCVRRYTPLPLKQCNALCEETGRRCEREVWKGDTFKDPKWCKQHNPICLSLKREYSQVCHKNLRDHFNFRFLPEWMDRHGGGGYRNIMNNWSRRDLNNYLWNEIRNRPEYQGRDYKRWFNDLLRIVENCNARKEESTSKCFLGHGYKDSHEKYTKALAVVAQSLRDLKKDHNL